MQTSLPFHSKLNDKTPKFCLYRCSWILSSYRRLYSHPLKWIETYECHRFRFFEERKVKGEGNSTQQELANTSTIQYNYTSLNRTFFCIFTSVFGLPVRVPAEPPSLLPVIQLGWSPYLRVSNRKLNSTGYICMKRKKRKKTNKEISWFPAAFQDTKHARRYFDSEHHKHSCLVRAKFLSMSWFQRPFHVLFIYVDRLNWFYFLWHRVEELKAVPGVGANVFVLKYLYLSALDYVLTS